MKWIPRLTLLVLVAAVCPAARGERPAEDPEAADVIVTGTVEKVYSRKHGRLNDYLVQIRVEQVHANRPVERGGRPAEAPPAVGPKDRLLVTCFQMDAPAVPVPEAGGHDAVPEEGQRVKAFVRRRHRGELEGNYSKWFDDAPAGNG